MKFHILSSILVIVLAAGAVPGEEKAKSATPSAAERFETLKKLVGDWVEVGKDGKPTDKLVSSIRLTAGGSAIHETIFPGSEKEMVTIYTLDGPDIVLTHYCMLGNQPRMRAELGKDCKEFVFQFTGAGNLKSENEHHMRQATLIFDGKDRLQAEWVSSKEGKFCHKVNLELVRKQK